MKRLDPSVGSSLTTISVIAGVGLLLSLVTLVPSDRESVARLGSENGAGDLVADGQPGPGLDPVTSTPSGAMGEGSDSVSTGSRGVVTPPGLSCSAGKNGGSTDVGVSASTIKLAATVVDDGPGASFLAPVRIGMNAVVKKVNRAGGICGRSLELVLRNDSWDAQRGQQFIQNFVEGEKVFALAVVPSSEGLRAADRYIQEQQVPVVGTDGMLIHQYRNPWIWPVATSTISTMHVMAKSGADRGAKNFSIVFDAKYHFGVEGAYAYNQAVKRLTGKDIPGYDSSLKTCTQRFCGIQPGKSSYGSEAHSFNDACGLLAANSQQDARCDFIALLLEPDTAESFMKEPRQADPTVGYGGAQPLFNRKFAEGCGTRCNNMWVWTGYNPPIEALASDARVNAFVQDVRLESSSADVTNQFLEGGYVGMSLLTQALKRAGPNLTRANLRAALDSMSFDIGLSRPLTWSAGRHFANVSARPFAIQFRQSFNGYRTVGDFIVDPWVGQDIPAGE